MKHTNEVQKLLAQGKLQEALEASEALLKFAPQNSKAMLLKAQIHNLRGEFDLCLQAIKKLAQSKNLDAEEKKFVYSVLKEEQEVQWFTELQSAGRVYYSDTKTQMAISFIGLLGCLFFLFALRTTWGNFETNLVEIIVSFVGLVCLPWAALLYLHFSKIRCVTLGMWGIVVQKGFSVQKISWSAIDVVLLEHGSSVEEDHLMLHVFPYVAPEQRRIEKENGWGRQPWISFNVSRSGRAIQARRHFVQNLMKSVGVTLTVQKQHRNFEEQNTSNSHAELNDSKNPENSSKKDSNNHVA
jgi:hypothetical protein